MPMTLSTPRPAVLSIAVLLLLAGCASTPEIRYDTNPEARFANYRSFAFFSPLATDRAGYETVFTTRLKDATRRAMEAKGYVYDEAKPDLLLNFFANVQEKQEIRTAPVAPYGYYGYRRGYYGGFGVYAVDTYTYTYREGTLTVDLVEARRKLLVWQGTAEGTVSNEARRNPGPAIDAVVGQIMAAVPPAAAR